MRTTRLQPGNGHLEAGAPTGPPEPPGWRRPARLTRWLAAITVALLVVGGVVRVAVDAVAGDAALPQAWLEAGARLVDVDAENNIPTWFSSGLLAGLGGAFALVAVLLRARGERWWTFALPAVICLGMSLDEFASIHNDLALVTSKLGAGQGVGFGWVLPGAVLAACVGAVLLLVARSWTASLRWRLVVAGGVYLFGAVGFEIISSPFYVPPADGVDDSVQPVAYVLLNVVEEGLEMFGVILALAAVLSLLRVRTGPHGAAVDLDPEHPALSVRARGSRARGR